VSDAAIRREFFGTDLRRQLLSLLHPRSVRATIRLGMMVGWTTMVLVVLVAGMWATTPWPRRRLQWRNGVAKRWALGICRIIGLNLRVEGTPPPAPFFLVANHLSYVDIVVLLSSLDGVFVAKGEVDRWPVVGYLTRLAGTIFVERRNHRDAMRTLDAIEARIAAGDGVMAFPEGTSSEGAEVLALKPALFEWAARTRFPVHCVTLGYETPAGAPPARTAVCWWGDMAFVPHLIGLVGLPWFRATIRFAPEAITGDDRAILAAQAREVIAARLASHVS